MNVEKKSITANALMNIIKTCASIVFPLITYPYAARVLEVNDMGAIEFSRSIINYVGLVAGLGISTYAIREGAKLRNDRERLNRLANQLFSINVIMTVLALGTLLIAVYCFPYLRSYGSLLLIFSLIPVGTTLTSDWVNSIYEDFGYITIRNVIIQFIALILILVLVKDKNDYLIYAGILTFSSAGTAIPNWMYIRKYCRLRFTVRCDLTKHLKPILLIFAINVATAIYVNIDTTMLNIMCGEYDNGIYGAAVRVYNIFKNLVSAIVIVTVPRLSALQGTGKSEDSKKLMSMVFNVMFSLVMPLCLLCGLLSDDIIAFIGGSKYALAATPLRILSVSLMFSSLASFMTTSVLLPNGKEKYIFRASVVSAAANLLLNFWLIPWLSYVGAAITTLIAELLMLLIAGFAARKHFNILEAKQIILKCIVSSLGIFAAWGAVNLTGATGLIRIFATGILGMLIYFLIDMKLWKLRVKDILDMVRKMKKDR